MSPIQWDLTIDLPREIGRAWKTPVGCRAYWRKALKNGASIARVDAAQDAEMKFEVILLPIEDPAEGMADVAGDGLDRDIGHQVEIDLRAAAGR